MHDEEEKEEEGWNDIILAVEFQLVHIAVHKAALQPSQECKLQQCSNRPDAGEGDTKLRNVASFLAKQMPVQFSIFSFPFSGDRRG